MPDNLRLCDKAFYKCVFHKRIERCIKFYNSYTFKKEEEFFYLALSLNEETVFTKWIYKRQFSNALLIYMTVLIELIYVFEAGGRVECMCLKERYLLIMCVPI